MVSMVKKTRRVGATETFSVSVDSKTKQSLKAQAYARHQGNVSALIAELAIEGERMAAFERAWQWYGGDAPTKTEAAALLAQWEAAWKLVRGPNAKRRKAA
jgi:hypothetical protein